MNFRLVHKFGVALTIVLFSLAKVEAVEPKFLGHGSYPQWSPSGKSISVLRSDSILIFDSKTLEVRRQLPSSCWHSYLWYNEDSLTMSSQSRTEAEKPGERSIISAGTALSSDCKEAFAFQRGTMEIVPSPSCLFAYASSDSDEFAGIIDPYGVEVFKIGARVTALPNNRCRFVTDPCWSATGRYFAWVEEVEDGHYSYGSELKLLDLRDNKVITVASDSTYMIPRISWSPTCDEFLLSGKADRSIWKFSLSGATNSSPALRRIGVGSMPQWSPDNKYISFIKNDSLLVVDTAKSNEVKLLCTGAIRRYYWTEPEQAAVEIQYDRRDSGSIGHVSIILSCDIDGKTEVLSYDSTGSNPKGRSKGYRLERFADGSIGYYFMVDSVESTRLLSEANALFAPTPAFYVRNTPYPNGPELQYTLLERPIQCLYPRLAPTGDKFCCENYNGELVVYDTSGVLISNLGRVDWSSWDCRGEWVIYEIMNWGHYDLLGSDVGIAKFDGSRRQRLTFSNESDQRASFSRDGKRVLFREGKTGEIFVLSLEE